MDVTNHDHTVSGMRPSVMPRARSVRMVTSTLTALNHEPIQKSPMLRSQQSMPPPCPGPAEGDGAERRVIGPTGDGPASGQQKR